MILDADTRTLIDGEKTARVSKQQCRLLERLARGNTVGMASLVDTVWPNPSVDCPEAGIRLHIHKLRRIIDIGGEWGVGYRLAAPLEIRRSGPQPLTVAGEYRASLERLLYSHPDRAAADRVLASMVGG